MALHDAIFSGVSSLATTTRIRSMQTARHAYIPRAKVSSPIEEISGAVMRDAVKMSLSSTHTTWRCGDVNTIHPNNTTSSCQYQPPKKHWELLFSVARPCLSVSSPCLSVSRTCLTAYVAILCPPINNVCGVCCWTISVGIRGYRPWLNHVYPCPWLYHVCCPLSLSHVCWP